MAHYWKKDSEKGFIEDTALIKYEKFNNLRHSVIGFMMGDFDNEGNYVISPQVKRELIEMPKYIAESIDNIEICHSELKLNRRLSFMVTFEGNRATLSLLEKMNYEANYKLNSGSYSNVNEYLLDEVVTSGAINRNTIYQRWNIMPMGSHEVDIFNCDEEVLAKYFGVVRRFKYLMAANTKLLEKEEEIEEIESGYSNRLLEILKAYPALNDVVLEEIKMSFEEKEYFVCADEPNFAKTLNEIIDTAIEHNLDVLTEEEQLNFKVEHRNLIVETNIRKEEVLDIQERVQPLSEEDKKYNEKHSVAEENTIPIVEIEIPETELAKPVEELAIDFAKTQKVVTEEIKGKVVAEEVDKRLSVTQEEHVELEQTEKQNLIDTIEKVVGEKVSIITEASEHKIDEVVENNDKIDNNVKVEAKAGETIVDPTDSVKLVTKKTDELGQGSIKEITQEDEGKKVDTNNNTSYTFDYSAYNVDENNDVVDEEEEQIEVDDNNTFDYDYSDTSSDSVQEEKKEEDIKETTPPPVTNSNETGGDNKGSNNAHNRSKLEKNTQDKGKIEFTANMGTPIAMSIGHGEEINMNNSGGDGYFNDL